MTEKKRFDKYDVIVIGAGPAGSTAAYILANQGYSVLILEKAQFPRFHIGESMIPYLAKIYQRLGIFEKVEEHFVLKPAVELTLDNGQSYRVEFAYLPEDMVRYSFNLERSAFDNLLLENAKKAGAHLLSPCHVKSFIFEGERMVGVKYLIDGIGESEVRADYVVDASGRAGLISRHFKLRKMNPRLEHVAVFQQYQDLDPDKNPSNPGDIVLSGHKDGWLWGIPLSPTRLSVGTVMKAKALKGNDPQALYDLHLSRAPRIKDRIAGGTAAFPEVKIESDFCYHSETLAGPGYFIVGDAGCFVDPLFSAGCYLGMIGGLKAAEMIVDITRNGRDEQEGQQFYQDFCKTGYDSYFRLVYFFYDGFEGDGDLGKVFMGLPGGFTAALQTLSGDFWGMPDQPLLNYLRAKEDYNTFSEPFKIIHGCPVYTTTIYQRAKENPIPMPF
jgi:FADH2-dependent halogenase